MSSLRSVLTDSLTCRGHPAATRRNFVPSICRISMFNDTFAHVLPNLIASMKSERIPTFVMIDPFGISGVGMEFIRALMEHLSTEVYVSFMYESMNRFKRHPNSEPHLDDLFGCADWQQGIDMPEGKARKSFFYGLYREATEAFRSPARP